MDEPFSRLREKVADAVGRMRVCEVTRLGKKALTPALSRNAGEGVTHA